MNQLRLGISAGGARAAALATVATCLAEALPLEDLLNRALDAVIEALDAEAGAVRCPDVPAAGPGLALLRGRSAGARHALRRLQDEGRLLDAVLASGDPLALADVPGDLRLSPELQAALRAAGTRSYAGVPLRIGGGARGVLGLARAGAHFSGADLEFLGAVARQLSLRIENADLAATGGRWRAAGEALTRIGRAAASTAGVRRILEVVVEEVLAVVGGAACGLFVLGAGAGRLTLAHGIGLEGRPGLGDPIPLGQGAAGRAVASRAWTAVPKGGDSAALSEAGFPSVLAVPLMVRDEPFGALVLYRDRPEAFVEADARLLDLMGVHAGITLETARLHAETARKRDEAEALQGLTRLISSTLDVDEILRVLVERTCQVLGVRRCGLWESHVEGEHLVHRLVRGVGLDLPAWQAVRVRLGEGTTGGCIARRAPVWTADILRDPAISLSEVARARVIAEGFRAVCSAPIMMPDGPFGVLAVYRDDIHAFEGREVALLSAFADQAAVAIANASLFRQQREAAAAADRQRARSDALAAVGQAIAASRDLDAVLAVLVERAAGAAGADAAAILEWDPGTGVLRTRWTHGLGAGPLAHRAVPAGVGIPGVAAATGRPRWTGDTLAEPGLAGTADRQAPSAEQVMRGILSTPIRGGEGLLGVLNLLWRAPHRFHDEEVAFAGRVAEQAAIAIDTARLLRRDREQQRQMEAVRAVTAEILRELDLNKLLRLLCRGTGELLGTGSGVVWLWDEATQVLTPTSWNGHGEWIREVRLHLGEGVAGAAAQQRKGLIVNDYQTSPYRLPAFADRAGVTAVIAEPLLYHDRLLGVITLDNAPSGRRYTEQDRATLALVASQAAIAIENARLYQEERDRSRDLAALIRAGRAVTSSLDLTQILGTIVTSAVELTGASLATLRLMEAGEPLAWQACADHLQEEFAQAAASEPITVERSLSDSVAAGRRSLWQPDIAADPRERYPDFAARHGLRCYLGAPILAADRVLGVLSIVGPAGGGVTEGRQELLESLAAQAALAIENARLYAQTREAYEELSAIQEAGQAIAQSLDLQETLQRILGAAVRLTGSDKGILRLLDEGRQELVEACTLGVPAQPAARLRLDEPSLSAACLREGRALVSTDPAEDPRVNRALDARFGDKALIAVPLRSGGRTIGVLDVGDLRRPRRFGAREIAILERLAQQAVVAIENARLFGQVSRSQSEWENTFDSISDLVAVVDPGGRIVRANRALMRRLDLPPGQVLQQACGDVLGDNGPAWGGCPHRRAVGLGARVSLEVEDERLGGTYSVGVFPVRDAGGRVMGTVHIARDITEQKTIQSKLFQADKLASMGTLAAGVAHNINNVLAAIVARADLVLASAADPETRHSAEVIQQAAMDGAETVRRLQEFAKVKPAATVALMDVNQAVRDALEFTQARWRDEARARGAPLRVETRLEATAHILGNAAEIREVLLNLILNAADAMPRGGTLRIATADRRVFLPAGTGGTPPQATVEVRVEDTGIGMPEAVCRRIFDPFFTTKGLRGTGLGLSVSYGLVTKHGGEIAVRSREAEGTTFILTFPAAAPDKAAPPPQGAPPSLNCGRLLLVEDEGMLREAIAETLTLSGHQVVAVGNGREAIDRFRPGAFDVVLTDLGMPGVSGLDLARAVKEAEPAVYVILCTGWGSVPGTQGPLRERGVDALLTKPFRIAEVAQAVRAGLASRVGAA